MYQGEEYDYYEYRLTDDGLLVCDYMDDAIQHRWRDKIKKEKHLAFKHCNVSVVVNITYYKPKQQSFTSKDNGVYKGYFVICLKKLILSCNDHLVRVKYGSEYKLVFRNFSVFYE